MTDVLGVMVSWSQDATVVRTDQAETVVIALRDIVSGKPVPPRPTPRLRVAPETAQRLAAQTWPAATTRTLGDWLLRDSGGFSGRASSALALGDPGMPVAAALAEVCAFYAERGRPAHLQVVVGSAEAAAAAAEGWRPARPDQADVSFQLSGTAQVLRAAGRLRPQDAPPVSLAPRASAAWLADDARARSYGAAALAVLEGPSRVVFASVGDPVVAKGRCALTEDGGWAGLTDLWVDPAHRRRGLAVAVVHALLDWAASYGATTMFLQVVGDNEPATALYSRLGLVTHHTTRYLAPPGPRPLGAPPAPA
jgi:GNAT superfamily N-acetyltransferase